MLVLSLNLGLKSVRAIVFDRSGQTIASEALPVTTTLKGGMVEQCPDEWWDKLCAVVKAVTEDQDVAEQIELATVTCSSSCLIAVDENIMPLRQAIMVSDRRAEAEAADIGASPTFQALSKEHNLICTSMLQMPRMLWIKHNEPEVFARTRKFLAPNDYLVARLTRTAPVTDPLNAEKSYFIRDRDRYAETLYSEMGIPVDTLPAIKPFGFEVGHIHPEVAGELGLPQNIRLRLSTYDAICSVFGTGLRTEGMVCDVSGTVSSVRLLCKQARVDAKERIFCQRFEPADCYLIGGSNNLGGGLIEWTKQCFYKNEVYPYEVMEKEARESKPGAKGLVFLPYLLGARAPIWNSEARGVFFGLERFHNRGDMARAVFESVGFGIREFTDIFIEMDADPTSITASGGLARIPLVNEIKADVTGVEYQVMEEFESTSLGAALIILVAEGCYESYEEASRAMVRTRQVFYPKRKNVELYDELFSLYRNVYDDLVMSFSKRHEIMVGKVFPPIEHIDNL
jgi:xylulokinase